MVDLVSGRTRARLVAPVNVTGVAEHALHGPAENGVNGAAAGRGLMVLSRDRGAVLAVNHVWLEHYLYGVVPAEMPASWPTEAPRAQAVVARLYALASLRRGAPYDVFADVRLQVYRGLLGEVDATTYDAVRATNARVVTSGAGSRRRSSSPPRAAAPRPTKRHSAARRCPTCARSPTRTTTCRGTTPGRPASRGVGRSADCGPRCQVGFGARGGFAHAVGTGRHGRGAGQRRQPGQQARARSGFCSGFEYVDYGVSGP